MWEKSELLAQCDLDPSTRRIAKSRLVKQRCVSAGILNILSTIRDISDRERKAGAAQNFRARRNSPTFDEKSQICGG